ncbi:hypothetical protein SAMN05216349_13914 [Oribacterium sp. KHPX15]|uniref:hypothetical protein n=1 Tax=unclassified Oribacterium TaxID=2629782 RepID=UPI0004E12095|nr:MULTISPECIES: hypothetical protein [unclassified Oribacterium]SEA86053.1 hypothetical protein SAMN05216349_13914 [Oribacterium sp. KHPX15]
MRRIIVLISLISLALSACGSSSKTRDNNVSISSETQETDDSNSKTQNDDPVADSHSHDLNETASNGAVEHKRIDSDIMEHYGIYLIDWSEEQLIYDENGNLVTVMTTDRNGAECKQYDFSYFDSGRVKEIIEYSNGNPVIIIDYDRNEKGQKTVQYSKVSDNKGGFADTAIIYTEYDESGNRIYDYPYTADGARQESYSAYLYDSSGNRIELQCRDSVTDEVISNELYEYDSNGRLICSSSYFKGVLSSKTEYKYDGDLFDSLVIYTGATDNEGITGYDLLLPSTLYELQDY